MWIPVTRSEMEEHNALWKKSPTVDATAQAKRFARRQLFKEKEVIERNVNWLLSILYYPDAEVGARTKSTLIKGLAPGAEREAINWGDLGVSEVRRFVTLGTTFQTRWSVTIEEADPGAVSLQRYIASWLEKWGWVCAVRTEW